MIAIHQREVAYQHSLAVYPAYQTALVLVHHALDQGDVTVLLRYQLVEYRSYGRASLSEHRREDHGH